MKKALIFSLAIISNLSIADICATDRNVKDYFLSIPHEEVKIVEDYKGYLTTQEERSGAINILDKKNGYISLQNKTINAATEIVLYRASENKPVILITKDGDSVQNQYAFACYDNRWHNVKRVIFKKPTSEETAKLYANNNILIDGEIKSVNELSMVAHTLVRYQLPRHGKAIKAYASHPDLDFPKKHVLFEFEPSLDKIKWH